MKTKRNNIDGCTKAVNDILEVLNHEDYTNPRFFLPLALTRRLMGMRGSFRIKSSEVLAKAFKNDYFKTVEDVRTILLEEERVNVRFSIPDSVMTELEDMLKPQDFYKKRMATS